MFDILFVVYNKTIEKRVKSLDDGAHFFLMVAMADGGNSSLLLFKAPTRFPLGRCFYMPPWPRWWDTRSNAVIRGFESRWRLQ